MVKVLVQFTIFLCVFTILLCACTISPAAFCTEPWFFCFSLCVHYFSVCVHYICSELVVCSEPKMIHVFPQDDTCISPGWYHNCVHYFCWELSSLSRDWARCPSHLLSESRRCRGYVAVFFTARVYLLFYATMQICTTQHNVLQHLSLFSRRGNKLLSTRHTLCCQICFHVMKIGKIK